MPLSSDRLTTTRLYAQDASEFNPISCQSNPGCDLPTCIFMTVRSSRSDELHSAGKHICHTPPHLPETLIVLTIRNTTLVIERSRPFTVRVIGSAAVADLQSPVDDLFLILIYRSEHAFLSSEACFALLVADYLDVCDARCNIVSNTRPVPRSGKIKFLGTQILWAMEY
jgi:hypothetical protein